MASADSTSRKVLRWVLVGPAVAAAIYVTLVISFVGLTLGPYPRDLAEPTTGFLLVAVATIVGAMVAPRVRLVVAVVLAGITLVILPVLVPDIGAAGGVLGAVVSVGAVSAWQRSCRSRSGRRRVRRAVAALAGAGAGLVVARYVDWPARADEVPVQLSEILVGGSPESSAFYTYDLGGFLDREWLWRIDAPPETIAAIRQDLRLQSTPVVPERFWRMAPHYWPRERPASSEAFKSPGFVAEDRGQDGPHYFLLHDRDRGRAYVWFKDNF